MFKKPSKKGIGSKAVTVSSAVAGAALSDGVVALIPEEYKKWGKPAFAIATAIAAAATKNQSTIGQAAEGALIGMSIKQGLDFLRETISGKMTVDVADTQFANFKNKVLGLASADQQIMVPRTMNAKMFSRSQAPRAAYDSSALASAAPIVNGTDRMLA